MRRLTPEELASRREHGLCFSCDEKFHRGHRCAPRVHLLIVEDDDPPDPDSSKIDGTDPAPVSPDGPDPYLAQISLILSRATSHLKHSGWWQPSLAMLSSC